MSEVSPFDFIVSARCPESLRPQEFGLWTIRRQVYRSNPGRALCGFDAQTILFKLTPGTLHQPPGDIVMEDGIIELYRHMPIWLQAHGRVLITGLGLGCVVRGLLRSPRVEHVDVVEVDPGILRVVGAEFERNSRVALHLGDALEYRFPPGTRWDCAWHDLYVDDSAGALHRAHLQLITEYRDRIPLQGAWQLPRWVKRFVTRKHTLLGAAR